MLLTRTSGLTLIDPSKINHDLLLNWISNKHIDHSSMETKNEDIDFSGSSDESITITISDRPREVLRARLWIDADPGSAFSQWAEITFYNKASQNGEDAFYRIYAKIVYTELEVATTGSDANIIPDDHTDFNPNDLIIFLDDDEKSRLQTIGDTMVAEDNVGSHSINTGLSRIIEFSGFVLFNNESGSNTYMKIKFGSSQTVSLKLEMILR